MKKKSIRDELAMMIVKRYVEEKCTHEAFIHHMFRCNPFLVADAILEGKTLDELMHKENVKTEKFIESQGRARGRNRTE